MDGHQDKINMTQALKALSPYLENPRRIVIRNEAFVAVAAAMLFLQLILGPWRRRSGHWFVQGTLWLVYTASFPLITYTLGQMATSPVKNVLYPVWALILFWASGCADAFMAYNIEDNKRWKRSLFVVFQYSVFPLAIAIVVSPAVVIRKTYSAYGMVLESLLVVFPLLILLSAVLMANLYRVAAGWMAMNSAPSKLVVDYMRAQVQVNTRSIASQEETSTMNSCKYLVRPNNITIEAIWGMTVDDDSLLKEQLRDVCLSFALSHLLRRRYFGMDCAEAGLPKTLRFALEGLLPEVDQVNHYSRAFHVIEVELGFLYDLFFTKHATLFTLQGNNFDVVVVHKLIFTSVGVVLLIWSPLTIQTPNPIIEVGTRRVDVTVTVVIMGALLLFEVLQAILYLTSDWAAVSVACSYARGNTGKLTQSIFRFLRRFIKFYNFLGKRINLFGYWQNKMGQSSVIGGSLLVNQLYVIPDSRISLGFSMQVAVLNLFYSMISSMKNFVLVPDLAKREIVSCLRIYGNCGGPLTNGKAALRRNGVLGEFSSTLKNDSQIKVMLIWHVATEYCNIASSDGAEGIQLHSGAQQVATTLSKYCAYLMYFVPELLAENSTDTLFIVHDLLKEVQSALGGDKPTRDRLLRVIQDSETIMSNHDQTVGHDSDGPDNHATIIQIPPVSNNTDNIIHDSGGGGSTDNIIHDSGSGSNNDNIIHDSSGDSNNGHTTIAQDSATNDNEDSILIRGLKLGRDLEAKDVNLRWKVMSEFWAETIIYIAPSDKAAEHMERLAQGGEFLTHVWALLTHAGILKRDHMIPVPEQIPTTDQMPTPDHMPTPPTPDQTPTPEDCV